MAYGLAAGKAEPRTSRIHVTRLKNWRRVSARHNRYPDVFFSAIYLTTLIMIWLCVLKLAPPPLL
ncbi:UNVERIFIED_CONTAM: hypothetical protein JM85_0975 [Acetobacter peroxydans]